MTRDSVRRSIRNVLLAACVIGYYALSPTTQAAQPPDCVEVCNPSASCEEVCKDPFLGQTTCGEYGLCGASAQTK